MGNFSVNHYSKISLEREGIRVSYIIDLAEIPTYQELQQGNVTANVADPAVIRFVASRGAEFARGLSLLVDGQRLPLRLLSSQVIFPPGAGGLPTMKMGFVYQAAYPPAPDRSSAALEYSDNNYPGHAGWKEIVAVGPCRKSDQQLSATDGPQRRAEQLPDRPAQQPAAGSIRSDSIPLPSGGPSSGGMLL